MAGWSGPEGFPAIGDRYAGAVCAQCRTYTTTAPPKRASQCAQGDSNSHGLYRPQGPQPCGAVPVGGEQVVQAGEDRLECCHVGEVDLGDALVAVGLRARGDCCARALCSHTSIRTAGVFASLSAFGWSHSTVSGAKSDSNSRATHAELSEADRGPGARRRAMSAVPRSRSRLRRRRAARIPANGIARACSNAVQRSRAHCGRVIASRR